MTIPFAGAGKKRPQIDIPLSKINLDSQNPRLAEEHQGGTQPELLRALYEHFGLEEIAYSMSENGYFDEEPIVVVPHNLPKNFKWDDDVNKLQTTLENLVSSDSNVSFVVVEGNRRIATAKLLTDSTSRTKLKISAEDFPCPKHKDIEKDLLSIPAIIYRDRKDVSPYLGVRHITGILKWEAYAKAKYISSRIEEENKKVKNIAAAINEVQRKAGDSRSDVIKKQYIYYKVLEQAKEDLGFDATRIIDRFSLLTVAFNSSAIRDYAGVPFYKDVNFAKPLVPKNKIAKLEMVLSWIFGNGKDKEPVLTDSRKITSHLAPVLADEEATEYLITYSNLEEAYERSGGDKEFVKKKIKSAKRNVSSALQLAYKYKNDKEMLAFYSELFDAVEELGKALNKK